jgi:hypothetical protein
MTHVKLFSSQHLSILYIGIETVDKCRNPIGLSYAVQQRRFRVVRLSSLVYVKQTGLLHLRLTTGRLSVSRTRVW